jgi:hypothetical protein
VQCGRAALAVQFASVRHCTHVSVIVSQTPPAPVPPMQFALVRHCTHRFVVVLHTAPPPAPTQFMLVRHWTHKLVVVLQTVPPPPPAHCVFVVQLLTQRLVIVSHPKPVWQLPFARQATHCPAEEQ